MDAAGWAKFVGVMVSCTLSCVLEHFVGHTPHLGTVDMHLGELSWVMVSIAFEGIVWGFGDLSCRATEAVGYLTVSLAKLPSTHLTSSSWFLPCQVSAHLACFQHTLGYGCLCTLHPTVRTVCWCARTGAE
jgi:hypothetical protein